MVAQEELLTMDQICAKLGINGQLFKRYRLMGVIPGPEADSYVPGGRNPGRWDPSVVGTLRRVMEFRKAKMSWELIRIKLELPVALRKSQLKVLPEIAELVSPNPGLAKALKRIERKVRRAWGGDLPGTPLYSIERRGEDTYLVFFDIGY